LSETPEDHENTPADESEAVGPDDAAATEAAGPDDAAATEAVGPDDAAAAGDETTAADEATRAASSSEPTAESTSEETPAEEPVAAEEPAPEAPAEEAPAEEPAVAEEPAAEEPVAEAAVPPGDAAEEPAGVTAAQGPEREEEYEPAPRQKPEIPGADLEPVFIPQEEQYLDAEAQAAAEAEEEAEAERARVEAEEEQSRPIADAAIDLAAGARYTATGKRKTAVARVILKPGEGTYLINGKPLETFFPRETLQRMIRQPLETVGYEARMDVIARMHGGGVSAQAGALRHGISRALIVADPNLRGELKRRGYLTRDPRVKERKKAGLKKARKRPQFSKR
jgi:small subunit ribosomal protein S9